MTEDHEKWDEDTALREERYRRDKENLTKEYEQKIDQEQDIRTRISTEKDAVILEFEVFFKFRFKFVLVFSCLVCNCLCVCIYFQPKHL